MLNGGISEYIDNPEKFKKAKYVLPVFATASGYISKVDADICGSIARFLGAGRMNNENEIDNSAGIVIEKKIGDEVKVGEVLAYVHTNDETKANGAVKNLVDAFEYSSKPIKVKSRVLEMYGI